MKQKAKDTDSVCDSKAEYSHPGGTWQPVMLTFRGGGKEKGGWRYVLFIISGNNCKWKSQDLLGQEGKERESEEEVWRDAGQRRANKRES